MGGNQSNMPPEYPGARNNSGTIRIPDESKSEGMFGKFMKFSFGSG
jgi:hypothetical protein